MMSSHKAFENDNLSSKSLFIAIEGGDGSGKGTQTIKLEERARKEGWDVLKLSFPQYGKPAAKIVENYLNGQYGTANSVHPDLGSLPYAIDRYSANSTIRNHLSKPKAMVIADRYMASNMAHQGTKLSSKKERLDFYEKIKTIEYEILGISRPSLNMVLLVPSSTAYDNIGKKQARSYTTLSHDIHENDNDHIEKSKANYQELCVLYPNEFIAVDCMDNPTTMRSVDDIHNELWGYVTSIIDKQ